MLVRLMYASRAADGVDAEGLTAILRQSRAGNPGIGITGVLCAFGGIFMQVIEGGRMPVNGLYNRISRDPRHIDVTLLSYEEIQERRFGAWAMGQVTLARLNPALLLKYSESAALDPWSVSGQVSMALFDEMVANATIIGPA
jgi:hypothetical protein